MRSSLGWLVVAASLALPRIALACPVCFDPNETARGAFYSTAIFLTLLPLGMIVGTTLFLVRRAHARELAESQEAQAPVRA